MIVVRISQLAQQLGIHRNTVRNWVKSGKLPARSIAGKRYLVTENDFWKLCQEFGLDRSSMNLKFVPGGAYAEMGQDRIEEAIRRVGGRSQRLLHSPQWGDVCLTCGSCASVCPISGIDGLDPRKAVRMAVLGFDTELIDSNWPWKCTLCGKCEEACPMNVEIVDMLRRVRSLRARDKVPGALHRGVQMCIERGNNLGIPKEDFVALLRDMAEEMQEDGYSGFRAPIDIKGANVLMTINSKEPFAAPDNMKFWWKIFYAAKESWTISSDFWEGVNWGFFTGDDESMKTMVSRLVDSTHKLECKTLLLPE